MVWPGIIDREHQGIHIGRGPARNAHVMSAAAMTARYCRRTSAARPAAAHSRRSCLERALRYVGRGKIHTRLPFSHRRRPSQVSTGGKEAVITVLASQNFFGEEIQRQLKGRAAFSNRFLSHMLTRNIRIEEI